MYLQCIFCSHIREHCKYGCCLYCRRHQPHLLQFPSSWAEETMSGCTQSCRIFYAFLGTMDYFCGEKKKRYFSSSIRNTFSVLKHRNWVCSVGWKSSQQVDNVGFMNKPWQMDIQGDVNVLILRWFIARLFYKTDISCHPWLNDTKYFLLFLPNHQEAKL